MARIKRLSPSQQYLFEKVKKTSRERARQLVGRLPSRKRDALEKAQFKIQFAPIIVSLNLHEVVFNKEIISDLMDAERVYNVFEVAHSRMGSFPSAFRVRIMLEFKLYGATPDIQSVLGGMSNTEHPNYGLLDYCTDMPIGYSIVGQYGWYRFKLKDAVKSRCTFTPADSMHIGSDQTFVWEDIEGVLATRVPATGRYWFEHINSNSIPIDARGNATYIEAQILGGVFLKDDIDVLYFPETDQYNEPFFDALEELAATFGFELETY